MSYSVQQVHDNFAIASPVIASSPGHSSSPGLRRLTDSDVRAIFEALHHEKPAPSHLPFQIVRVGPTGLKLSPPSYEFEGTFVLGPQREINFSGYRAALLRSNFCCSSIRWTLCFTSSRKGEQEKEQQAER